MQHVITVDEAREITKGRTPLVPVEYEEACRALKACLTLDEAKYWDNKADALAAWAKIYHNNDAERKARALKLWAYRRMGELAGELRPTPRNLNTASNNKSGFAPGSRALLMENGLSQHQAEAARRLARADRKEVERIANKPRPPAPGGIRGAGFKAAPLPANRPAGRISFSDVPEWTPLWARITAAIAGSNSVSATKLGASVKPEFANTIRPRIIAFIEWLDAFEQALPKEKRK